MMVLAEPSAGFDDIENNPIHFEFLRFLQKLRIEICEGQEVEKDE